MRSRSPPTCTGFVQGLAADVGYSTGRGRADTGVSARIWFELLAVRIGENAVHGWVIIEYSAGEYWAARVIMTGV